ncbi:MAG: NAD-glutamate dehydrogenase domain-containing protein, partial [Pseudomonadota bacterium]
MPEGFHLEEDERTLAQVIDVAVKSKADPDGSADALSPPFEAFLTQAVRYATGEDRNWDEPTSLLDRAVAVWALSAERRPGEHIIRIETEEADDWRGRRLVLDIVTDDRPFLVDSISGALTEAGKPVSFFLNAVVDTGRDEKGRRTMSAGDIVRESMIRAEMDPAVNEAEAQALRDEVERVLNDVAIAVEDWEAMRARLGGCVAQLERSRPTHVRRENLEEAVEFLKWLWDNRFAFLGVRRFNYRNEDGAATFARDEKLDLGILRDPERRVLKSTFSDGGQLSPAVEDFLRSDEPILVAKANARSHVHRRVHMDYVGVKIFALSGDVVGEERFVGLFTAEAYNRPASTIPLLRAKVRNVLSVADFAPGGHNEKALVNILETYPRDEMFQVDVQTLAETAHGILRLYKRPRVKLFVRRDRFDRFIAALVFIPRDRFNSTVRAQIGAYLAETFDGRVAAFYPTFGDATLVRVQFIIALEPGAPDGPGITEMTREIRTICREWRDDLLDATRRNADLPTTVFRRYEDAFDASYREHTPPEEALRDIAFMSAAPDEDRRTRVSRRQEDAPCTVRIKLYSTNGPVSLSQLIPTIENLGLRVHHEAAYPVTPEDAPETWIHDFHTEQRDGAEVDVDAVKPILENAIAAVMAGRTEDDAFNALVLLAQLNWREAWLMRAAARHHTLSGLAFSSAYIAETLAAHPTLTRDLVAYFHARFNPAGPKTMSAREKEADAAREKIVAGLDAVTSLDQDRIIRRYLRLFTATTRTNYFQTDADGA